MTSEKLSSSWSKARADLNEHPSCACFHGAALQREHQPEANEVGGIEECLGDLHRDAFEPFLRAPVLREPPRDQPFSEAALDHRGDQVVLVFEVPVDGAGGQAAFLADQPDAGALVSAFGGDFGRRVENPFPGELAVGALATGCGLFLLRHFQLLGIGY